jgi:hypothetical protein
MELATISKAIAGGVAAGVIALLARYGFQPDGPTVTAIGVIITALVGYIAGHLVVYLAPKNKDTAILPPVEPGDTHGL